MEPKHETIPENSLPAQAPAATTVPEIGGAKRATEPTRFGDWELNGTCVDF